jgi:hypothetical protein
MNEVNDANPASETSGVERLVRRLEYQYISQNDGGGRDGYCRVKIGDLLDLLQYVKKNAIG